ncbi:MAG: tandem-95 repeat protein, partial [Candidatus Cloacimonetes bacterium]|nr:tandem-95 repeat protein [Candidatus Cloacimonadota bacterium]
MSPLRLATVIFILFTMSYLIAAPDWNVVVYTGLGTDLDCYIRIDSVLATSADLVGAFVGDECRMLGYPSSVDIGRLQGVTIQGNTFETEILKFRIWDASNDVICDVPGTFEVTHGMGDFNEDLYGITPEILDSEITLGSTAGNQVTDFTVEVESYQGIAVDWNIKEIEFEVHYTDALLEFSGYSAADMLSAGSEINVTGTSSPIIVTITSGTTISGVDPIIGLTFSPQGIGGSSALDLQNFNYTDTGETVYSITTLNDGEAVITYENFPPVAIGIPTQEIDEDFTAYDINLNSFFSDENNDELSYNGIYDDTEIGLTINDSIMTLSAIENWYGETTVIITATDLYSATVSDTFDIVIASVNDDPVIDLPPSFGFEEDGNLEVDFTSYISDVDGGTPSLTVSENVNVTVNIVGYTVTFGALADWNSSEIVYFTVDDGRSRSTGTDSVEVIVTPVNDAPVITANSPENLDVNVSVDSLQLFSITVTDIDTDSGDLVYSWFIDEFEQIGETGSSFNHIFTESANYTVRGEVYDGEYTAEFTWNVFAYIGSATLDGAQISILNKTVHNGAGFSFDILTSNINEDWGVTSYSFNLAFDSTLVEYSSITNGVVSTGGSFSLTGTGGSINVSYSGGSVVGAGAIAELTFNTLEPGTTVMAITNFQYNLTGITELTNGNLEVVNDAPIVSLEIENKPKNEDFIDFSFDLDDHFNDPNGDSLSYSAVFDSTQIGIILNEVNGQITISSILNWFGTSTVTVTATDEYAAFVQEAFSVIVSSDNDLPIIVNNIGNFTKVEDFATFTVELDSVFFDVEDNNLDYQENLVSGEVTLDITGSILSIGSVAQWYGDVTVEVMATDDDGASVTESFNIEVTPVNDDPVFDLPESFSFLKNGSLIIDFSEYMSDVDADELILTVENDVNVNVTINDFEVLFEAGPDWTGYENLTFYVNDQAGRSIVSDQVLVTVVNGPGWDRVTYTSSGTVLGIVTIDGTMARHGDIVGAFYEGECRGLQEVNVEEGIAYLTIVIGIGGSAEEVNFKVYDASEGIICDVAFTTVTIPNVAIGAFDIDGETPLITDSAISVSDAASNQKDGVTLHVTNDIGIGLSWEVTSIEFDLLYDASILNYSGYSSGDTVVEDAGIGIDEELGVVSFTINSPSPDFIFDVGEMLAVSFDIVEGITADTTTLVTPANFVYNTTGITNLQAGTVTITYQNFAPTVELPIPDQSNPEDFTEYVIDLDDHFADRNGDVLLYSAEYTATEIGILIDGSEMTISSIENWNGSTEVVVTAEDAYNVTVSDTFMVEITPVNDIPVIALPDSLTFLEDESLVEDFSVFVSDIDEDVLSLGATGNDSIIVIIDGFEVSFSSVPDWNGSEIITFTVDDSQGRAVASDSVLVIVTAVNDAPEITSYFPEDLNINAPLDSLQLFSITVEDIDTAPESLVYSWYVDEDEQPEISSSFSYTFTENGNYSVKAAVSDGEYPVVIIWDVFAYVGSATLEESQISILNKTVHNGNNFSSNILTSYLDESWGVTSFSFTLGFNSAFVDYISISEGIVSSGGDFDVMDYGDSISVSYTGGDLTGAGAVAGLTFSTLEPGVTILTISNFFFNETPITTITNGTITILNDAPVVSAIIEDYTRTEDFADFSFDLDDHFSDPNGDVLSYVISNDSTEIYVSLNEATGELTISSIENWFGESSVTVTATDEYLQSVQDEFLVTVISDNDIPVIVSQIEDKTRLEDFATFTVELDSVFFDVEDNTLTYTSILTDGELALEITGSILSISSVENWYGTATVQVKAEDDNGASVTDEFNIDVTPVNDAPVINLPDNVAFLSDDGDGLELNMSGFISDVESADSLLTIDWSGNINLMITIQDSVVTITAPEGWTGSENVTFTVSDETDSSYDIVEVIVAEGPGWNPITYSNSTIAYTEVTIDGQPAGIGDYVGAFVGSECRGMLEVELQVEENITIATINIQGGTVETVNFRVYDASANQVYNVEYFTQTNPGFSIGQPPDNLLPIAAESIPLADADFYITDYTVNQVTPVEVAISTETGISAGWLINEYSFSLSFDDSVVEYTGYNLAETISEGGTLTVNDDIAGLLQISYSNTEIISGGGDLLKLSFMPVTDNGFSNLDMYNFSMGGENISTTDGSITVVYENFGPTVKDPPLPDQPLLEDFDDVVLDLNNYFSDENGDVLSYTAALDNAKINVDIAGSQMTISSVLNQYGTTEVIVTANDNYRATVSDTFIVTVESQNDDPSIVTAIPDAYRAEDFLPFQIGLSSYFSDVDGDVLSYSVNFDSTEVLAEIIEDVSLRISSVADWYGTATLTVTANDGNGGLTDQSFDVIVEPVNDGPVIISYLPADIDVYETLDPLEVDTNIAFELTASDVDDITLTYNWYINGDLQLSSSAFNFDHDFGIGEYTVRGEVTDGLETASITWNVSVFSVTGNLEDAAITVNNIGIDLGESGTVTVSTTPLAPAWGVTGYNFTLSFDSDLVDYTGYEITNTLSEGREILVDDYVDSIRVSVTSENVFDTGGALIKLVFNSLAAGTSDLIISNFDYEGTNISDLTNGSLTVVNYAPVVSLPLFDYNRNEDFLDFQIILSNHFSDANDAELNYSAVYDPAEIAIVISNDTLTVSSVLNWNGIAEFTVTADDGHGESISDVSQVTVAAVNDEPVLIDPIENFSKIEDFDEFTIDLNSMFDDVDDVTLTYSANIQSGEVGYLIEDGILTISPVENWNGTAIIEIIAEDSYFAAVSDTFEIEITPVNDRPVIDLPENMSILVNDGDGLTIDLGNFISDVESANTELSLNWTGASNISVGITSGLEVVFTAPVDWTGMEEITFTVSDDSLEASDNVEIIVTEGPDWELVIYTNSTTAYGLVTIDDNLAGIGDYVGAFVGEECRAFQEVVYDAGRTIVTMNIQGIAFEQVHFQVFDASANQAYNVDYTAITSPGNEIGSPDNLLPIAAYTIPISETDFSIGDYSTNQVNPVEIAIETESGISAAWNIDSYHLSVNYDSSVVSYTDYSTTGTISEPGSINVTNSTDSLYIEFTSTEDISGAGALLYITFTPVANNGNTVLDLNNFQLGVDEITNLADGSITIEYENFAPVVFLELADRDSLEDFEDIVIDLDIHFRDANDDVLTYSADYNEAVVLITINGNEMTISSIANIFGTTEVTVTANDNYRAIVTDTFTVTVTPENDAPEVSQVITNYEVSEDFNPFQFNLDDYFTDIDGDVLTYDITFENTEINAEIVDVTYLRISSILNWNGTSTVSVTADDNNGGAIQQTFNVIVSEVNDAPVIIANNPLLPDVYETIDTLATTINITFDITAEDVDDTLLIYNWYVNDNLESSSALNSFDYDFGIGNFIVIGEVYDGEYTADFTWNVTVSSQVGNLEESEIAVNNIDIDLGDSGTAIVSTTPLVLAWDVNSYSFTLNFDNSLVEYIGYSLAETISESAEVDIINNGNNIVVTATSVVALEGVGALIKIDFNSLAAGISALDISEFSYETTEIVNLTSGSINVINYSPEVILPLFDYPRNEDFDDFNIILSNHFSDANDPVLNYSVAYNDLEVAASIAGDILTISSVLNWNGVTELVVTANDGHGEEVSDSLLITITAINDAPEIVENILDYDVLEDFDPFVINLAEYIVDVDGDVLTYEITSNETQIVIELSGEILTISPVADWNGSAAVQVEAFDSEYSVSDDFVVNIAPVNDEPVINLPETISFILGEELVVDFSNYVSDVDGDELILSAIPSVDIGVQITGFEVTFSTSLTTNVVETIEFTVEDSVTSVSDITVVNANNGPGWTAINLTNSTVAYGNVTIDGQPANIGDIVGAFVNDECRGVGYVRQEGGQSLVTINIQGESQETVGFLVFDASADTIYTVFYTTLTNPGGDIGYPPNLLPIAAITGAGENIPPVANAGEDQEVYEGDIVVLDGTGSYDPEGEEVTYLWTAPAGIVLDDVTSATPVFTAPLVVNDTTYTIQLVVNDGELDSEVDEVIITVQNSTLEDAVITVADAVANEGDAFTVAVNTTALEASWGIMSYSFTLGYDVDMLEYTGYTILGSLSDGADVVVTPGSGTISYSVTAMNALEGIGTLIYLNFVSLDNGSTDLIISEFYYNTTEIVNLVNGTVTSSTVVFPRPWEVVYYTNSTVAYGLVTIDENPAAAGDEVGAFINGECRGIGIVSVMNDSAFVTMNIQGIAVELVNFAVWDASEDQVLYVEFTTYTDPGYDIGYPPNYLPIGATSTPIVNYPPVAVSGGPYAEEANEGYAEVTFDGSASYDLDGEIVNYEWFWASGSILTTFPRPWEPVVYTNSSTAYGLVTIGDLPAESGDEVGAFVGDECRGIGYVSVINDTSYVTMNIQGELAESVSFNVWDASEDQTYGVEFTTINTPGSDLGYPPNYLPIAATAGSTVVNNNFPRPWIPVTYTNSTVAYCLVTIDGELAENEDEVAVFVDGVCRGLGAVVNNDTTAISSINISGDTEELVHFAIYDASEGEVLNVTYTTMSNPGNDIGYPPNLLPINGIPSTNSAVGDIVNVTLPIGDYTLVLSVTDDFGDIDRDTTQVTIYEENIPPVADAGGPYEYNADETGYAMVTLDGSDSYDEDGTIIEYKWGWGEVATSFPRPWSVVYYTNSTVAYGEVTIDGELASVDDEVAAFVGAECRGVGYVTMEELQAIVSLNIQGELEETVHFAVYDASADEVCTVSFSTLTSPGNDIGYPPDLLPIYAVSTGGGTGGGDLTIFPRPWDVVNYTNSTVAYCAVTIDGIFAEAGDEVGAFVGAECRGVGAVTLIGDQSIASLNIQGETSGETVEFNVYDLSSSIIYGVSYTTLTSPGSDIGFPPDMLPIAATSSRGETTFYRNFPRPWEEIYYTNTTICYGEVTIDGENADIGDQVGVFAGSECRGVGNVAEEDGQSIVSINIQGEAVETVRFAVYDISADEVYAVLTVAETNPGGDIGYPPDMIQIAAFTDLDITEIYGMIVTLPFAVGTYDITLTVTDDDGLSDVDQTTLIVNEINEPPVADAGGPYEEFAAAGGTGALVGLDGSGSYDTDGNIVSWEWCWIGEGGLSFPRPWTEVYYTNSTVAYCDVKIDGELASVDDEVGAFVGTECRGLGYINIEGTQSVTSINIQGEEPEIVHFAVYDASADEVCTVS